MKAAFPGIAYTVVGIPKDLEGARDLATRDKHDFQTWAVTRLENAVPFRAGKKGADGGIDGQIAFRSGAKTYEKAIISVKGGANISVRDIRELNAVVDRERAKIGIYICLEDPTEPMRREAAGAGLYDTGLGKKVPKIQILTIANLFDGKRPDVPLMDRGFRTAARETRDDQSELDL
jgi:site-specific DNA-methyltransferase (adenine-specific)